MTRLFEGKHVTLVERDGWQFVERTKTNEAAAVIAETEDGELVLTEQFRRPVNARVIDFPAGLVGDEDGTDDPAETAKKELEEETGFSCQSVELLGKGPSSPGLTSEIVSLSCIRRASHRRGRGCRRGGHQGASRAESRPRRMVARAAGRGVVIDLKLAIYAAARTAGERPERL